MIVRTLHRRTGVIVLGGVKPSRCAWCRKLFRTGDRVYAFKKDDKSVSACRKDGFAQKRAKNKMIGMGVFVARKYYPLGKVQMPMVVANRFSKALMYLDYAMTILERRQYKKSPASKAHLN
jgi:hypothetical protein